MDWCDEVTAEAWAELRAAEWPELRKASFEGRLGLLGEGEGGSEAEGYRGEIVSERSRFLQGFFTVGRGVSLPIAAAAARARRSCCWLWAAPGSWRPLISGT